MFSIVTGAEADDSVIGSEADDALTVFSRRHSIAAAPNIVAEASVSKNSARITIRFSSETKDKEVSVAKRAARMRRLASPTSSRETSPTNEVDST